MDDWQWTRDEDLVQGSKSCGWESPHEMPLWVRMKRKEEEQKCEGSPIGSSHSIASSKKGRNPARQFKCMMA